MQKSRLKLEELPKRENNLSQDQLMAVFGGCSTNGIQCDSFKDCCTALFCINNICYG